MKLKVKRRMNKKGVFGLTSVQQFFAIILGIALLGYVIVIIMGTLEGASVLDDRTGSVVNETGYINQTGYQLELYTASGFSSPVISLATNESDGTLIASTEYAVDSSGIVLNATEDIYEAVNFTYSYQYDTQAEQQSKNIFGNTSEGITGFFGAINPVYAILAILVIILVLVVLVRVVTGGGGELGSRRTTPQL